MSSFATNTNEVSSNTMDTVGNTDLTAGLSRLGSAQGTTTINGGGAGINANNVSQNAAINTTDQNTPAPVINPFNAHPLAAIKPPVTATLPGKGLPAATPVMAATSSGNSSNMSAMTSTPTFRDAGSNPVTQMPDGSYIFKTTDGQYVDATPGTMGGYAEPAITEAQYNADLAIAQSTAAMDEQNARDKVKAGLGAMLSANTAAAASMAAAQAAQSAYTQGLSTALMLPHSAEDAAASTNQAFAMGLQRMGGGAYGAYDNAAGQAGATAQEQANTALGAATDQMSALSSGTAYIASALNADLQQHTMDAQNAIQTVTDSLDSLAQQIDQMSGQAQQAAQQQMVTLQGLLQTLQIQEASDAQGSAEFWSTFGMVANTVSILGSAATKLGSAS